MINFDTTKATLRISYWHLQFQSVVKVTRSQVLDQLFLAQIFNQFCASSFCSFYFKQLLVYFSSRQPLVEAKRINTELTTNMQL